MLRTNQQLRFKADILFLMLLSTLRTKSLKIHLKQILLILC